MVNQATLLGRVGKIDTKTTGTGIKITNLSMVTSKKFTKNGEKQEKTTWHNVTLFSKLAEIAEKYVMLGDLLFVQGEMDSQKYTTQDGQERTKFFIVGNDIKLMPKAKEHKAEPKKEMTYEEAFEDSEISF
jgi:single-strand DNA-binding protein